jgi:hypothetical protein
MSPTAATGRRPPQGPTLTGRAPCLPEPAGHRRVDPPPPVASRNPTTRAAAASSCAGVGGVCRALCVVGRWVMTRLARAALPVTGWRMAGDQPGREPSRRPARPESTRSPASVWVLLGDPAAVVPADPEDQRGAAAAGRWCSWWFGVDAPAASTPNLLIGAVTPVMLGIIRPGRPGQRGRPGRGAGTRLKLSLVGYSA